MQVYFRVMCWYFKHISKSREIYLSDWAAKLKRLKLLATHGQHKDSRCKKYLLRVQSFRCEWERHGRSWGAIISVIRLIAGKKKKKNLIISGFFRAATADFTMQRALFFLLILSCLCLALTQVSYDDCCLKYVKAMSASTQKHVMNYREQKLDGGCNIPATILIMRKGRMYCTDPSEKWVKQLKKRIDVRRARMESRKAKRHQQLSRRGWGRRPATVSRCSPFHPLPS